MSSLRLARGILFNHHTGHVTLLHLRLSHFPPHSEQSEKSIPHLRAPWVTCNLWPPATYTGLPAVAELLPQGLCTFCSPPGTHFTQITEAGPFIPSDPGGSAQRGHPRWLSAPLPLWSCWALVQGARVLVHLSPASAEAACENRSQVAPSCIPCSWQSRGTINSCWTNKWVSVFQMKRERQEKGWGDRPRSHAECLSPFRPLQRSTPDRRPEMMFISGSPGSRGQWIGYLVWAAIPSLCPNRWGAKSSLWGLSWGPRLFSWHHRTAARITCDSGGAFSPRPWAVEIPQVQLQGSV